ncbi:unnamed protein product [Chrysoparadoxa australica]
MEAAEEEKEEAKPDQEKVEAKPDKEVKLNKAALKVASLARSDKEGEELLRHLSTMSSSKATKAVNAADKSKRTALHLAAWAGGLGAVKALLRYKANARAKAMDNFTPLHFASQGGHSECCEALLDAGAKINAVVSKGNKTALMLAASKGHVDTVKLLLEAGADPNAMSKNGQSAAGFAKTDEIKQLIEAAVAAEDAKVDEADADSGEAEAGAEFEAREEGEGESQAPPKKKRKKKGTIKLAFMGEEADGL